MAKKNRRKKQVKQVTNKQIQKPKVGWQLGDLVFLWVIGSLGFLCCIINFLIITSNLSDLPDTAPTWLELAFALFALFVGIIVLFNLHQLHKLLYHDFPSEEIVKITRIRAVRVLSSSMFLLVIAGMPYLYKNGYITALNDWLSSWIPTKEKINENFSLALAFVLGAVVSGVLGNAAYDFIKFIIRKMLGGNPSKNLI